MLLILILLHPSLPPPAAPKLPSDGGSSISLPNLPPVPWGHTLQSPSPDLAISDFANSDMSHFEKSVASFGPPSLPLLSSVQTLFFSVFPRALRGLRVDSQLPLQHSAFSLFFASCRKTLCHAAEAVAVAQGEARISVDLHPDGGAQSGRRQRV